MRRREFRMNFLQYRSVDTYLLSEPMAIYPNVILIRLSHLLGNMDELVIMIDGSCSVGLSVNNKLNIVSI